MLSSGELERQMADREHLWAVKRLSLQQSWLVDRKGNVLILLAQELGDLLQVGRKLSPWVQYQIAYPSCCC